MKPRALITGITGQDGSYLAEHLLRLGYEVHGIVRPGATPRTQNIAHLIEDGRGGPPDALQTEDRVQLHYGDLTETPSIRRVLEKIEPHEVYNLGAQAHVGVSFQLPEYTAEATGVGCLRLLESIREIGLPCKFYQASSSELFGKVQEVPQRETTPFYPRSPYAAAKAMAFHVTRNYREAYGMFAVNGILFNHEGPRRGQYYVTRKVTLSAARIKRGLQDRLVLGNIAAERDWGYAPDFVAGMHSMLQHDEPDDYVLATGVKHSVQRLVEVAFAKVGMPWVTHVELNDPRFIRPSEVDQLLGDASKARKILGWKPTITFDRMIEMMVDADMERLG